MKFFFHFHPRRRWGKSPCGCGRNIQGVIYPNLFEYKLGFSERIRQHRDYNVAGPRYRSYYKYCKCEVERCWLRSPCTLSPHRLSIVLTKLGYGANTINPLSCWLMESGGMLGLAARWRHATRPRGTSVAATPSLKTRNRFIWQYFPHRQAGPVCWETSVHSI